PVPRPSRAQHSAHSTRSLRFERPDPAVASALPRPAAVPLRSATIVGTSIAVPRASSVTPIPGHPLISALAEESTRDADRWRGPTGPGTWQRRSQAGLLRGELIL